MWLLCGYYVVNMVTMWLLCGCYGYYVVTALFSHNDTPAVCITRLQRFCKSILVVQQHILRYIILRYYFNTHSS